VLRDPRFSILLPPGWVRIPVDDHTDAEFRELVESIVAEAPAERRSNLQVMLQTSVRDMLASARAQHTLDLIISLAAVDGLPIPASLTVSLLQLPEGSSGTPQEQLLKFARGNARAIELDGLVGMRRVLDDPGNQDNPPHRTVSYVCHLPWSDEWLLFAASIITTDEPGYSDVLAALEDLMDAMLSTVRFPRKSVTV
jgi:hypothetical protein